MADKNNRGGQNAAETSYVWEIQGTKLLRFQRISQAPRQTDLLFLVFQEEKPSPSGATVRYLYQ
jgi:hypothetical protein